VSVYLITDCPATYNIEFVVDGCRQGSSVASRPPFDDIFYAVPVSSRTSGLVYRNVYCATCHAEHDVVFWNVTAGLCDDQSVTSDEMDSKYTNLSCHCALAKYNYTNSG